MLGISERYRNDFNNPSVLDRLAASVYFYAYGKPAGNLSVLDRRGLKV